MNHIHQYQYTGTEYPIITKLSEFHISDNPPELVPIQAIREMRCDGCGQITYKTVQGDIVAIGIDFQITHGFFAVMLNKNTSTEGD